MPKNVLIIFGENNFWVKKCICAKLEKKRFFFFTPKPLPIALLKVQHSKEREKSYKKIESNF